MKMGYPKTINIEGYEAEIQQIESLKPGESLPLTGTPEAVDHIRYIIYTYLFHFRLKHLYKLRRISPELLTVTRKGKHRVTVAYTGVDETIKTFVSKYLLDISDEDEALALIRESLEKSQWLEAAEEWRRIIESGEKT